MAGTYHKTSVDFARTNNTTIAHVGQKRSLSDYNAGEIRPPSNKSQRTLSGGLPFRGDFHRPTLLNSGLKRIKASEIRDINIGMDDGGPSEYSQRRMLALTPGPTSNPILDLAHPAYRLPSKLVENLKNLGVKSIYPWQSECLLKSGALQGKQNLVYTAPTGGGKSLVADVLMLKKVMEMPGKKALLVLPYVALVQEKLKWLRKVTEGIDRAGSSNQNNFKSTTWVKRGDEDNIRVVGFFGGSKSKASWNDVDIAVCTIEKVFLCALIKL